MNGPLLRQPPAEPFFFDVEPGSRFCVYHAPAPNLAPRGGILYVHPFAEEMQRARHVAHLQARALAGLGFGVLQVDLFGCGDSCGDLATARWPVWQADLGAAFAWLRGRASGQCYLWGLRLGALMALDFAARTAVAGIVLWQPFVRGRTCINQFLRLRLARSLLASGQFPASTSMLRDQLDTHGSLEAGGYEVGAELAHAIDALDAANLTPRTPWVAWLATGAPGDLSAAATARRVGRRWPGIDLRFAQVPGPPIWAGAAQRQAPALIDTTSALFARVPA